MMRLRQDPHEPVKRAPRSDQMMVNICELAKQDPLGFHAYVWEFMGIGCFNGFHQQDFLMDTKN